MNNRSKYNVDNSPLGKLKRTYNGILFDSQLECRFYRNYLLPKLQNGTIKSIRRQVRYELLPSFVYIYDGKKQRQDKREFRIKEFLSVLFVLVYHSEPCTGHTGVG